MNQQVELLFSPKSLANSAKKVQKVHEGVNNRNLQLDEQLVTLKKEMEEKSKEFVKGGARMYT